LSFEAVGVERVNQADWRLLREAARHTECFVEGSLNFDYFCPVGIDTSQLSARHFAVRQQHHTAKASAGGIGRRAGCCIAGAGTYNRVGASRNRFCNSSGHAAVLEGSGGVRALEFNVKLGRTQLGCKPRHGDQRRTAFRQRDRFYISRQVEIGAVTLDNSGHMAILASHVLLQGSALLVLMTCIACLPHCVSVFASLVKPSRSIEVEPLPVEVKAVGDLRRSNFKPGLRLENPRLHIPVRAGA
jgi:hypothetical protein